METPTAVLIFIALCLCTASCHRALQRKPASPGEIPDPGPIYASSKDGCQGLLPYDGGNPESGEGCCMGVSQSESQGEKLPPPMEFHRIVTRSNKIVCDYSHFAGEETECQTTKESCPRSHCEEESQSGFQSPKCGAVSGSEQLLRRSECRKTLTWIISSSHHQQSLLLNPGMPGPLGWHISMMGPCAERLSPPWGHHLSFHPLALQGELWTHGAELGHKGG